MTLDLTSITKAIDALENAVAEAYNDDFMNSLTPQQQDIIRAGGFPSQFFSTSIAAKKLSRIFVFSLTTVSSIVNSALS